MKEQGEGEGEGEGKEEKVVPFPYSAMENKQKKGIYSTKD